RETQQQEDDEPAEHDGCEIGCNELHGERLRAQRVCAVGTCAASFARSRNSSASSSSAVFSPSLMVGSGPCPVRKARRLISSDQPCSMSSEKPTGRASHTGQRISPPELPDISPDWYCWITMGTV